VKVAPQNTPTVSPVEMMKGAVARAVADMEAFILNRPAEFSEQDEAQLVIVGRLLCLAKPKSRVRRMAWRDVALALALRDLPPEWMWRPH